MKNRIVLSIIRIARKYRVNQKYKDRIFRMIFRNKKDLLSLYNAVNGTDYTDEDELEIRTLEDAVYLGYKNDLSFLISNTLNLYEHQSTVNPNMPLRGLLYFSAMLKSYIEEKRCNIYGKTLVPLPLPKYLVFYNGTDELPDVSVLKLSDAFTGAGVTAKEAEAALETRDAWKAVHRSGDGLDSADTSGMESTWKMVREAEPALECKALVVNINKGHNRRLMEKCERLEAYAFFVAEVRDSLSAGYSLDSAIDRAIDECIAKDKLTDILMKNRAEVKNMLLTDFSEKTYRKMLVEEAKEEGWEKGRVEGWEKGKEEGWKKGRVEGWEKGRVEGWKKGRVEGWEKGKEEGWKKGKEEGWEKCNELCKRLFRDGRMEDLEHSWEDKEYQRQLMKEYGIDK